MRIVHLSDIHLSKDNFDELIYNYRDALIRDLSKFNSPTPIDLIVITGDLVDKGGHSLLGIKGFESHTNPYHIFKEVFIDPIAKQLGIPPHRFLFVPGNHDVDEREIRLYDEHMLCKDINIQNVHTYLETNNSFINNLRIKNFKDFEKEYYYGNDDYKFGVNQSTFFFEKSGFKIGFILINDSWRCKSIKLKNDPEKLYFGVRQLDEGLQVLEGKGTDLNICLFHHAVDDYAEAAAVKGILQRKKIELFLYGHFHNAQTNLYHMPYGSCLGFRTRAALFKPEELVSEFHCGYQILDFDLDAYKVIQVSYRKYNYQESGKNFNPDVETAPDGVDKNVPNGSNGFNLYREGRGPKAPELPIEEFIS